MHHPKVYIAGPYTHPDPVENTHRTIKIADVLADAGIVPYIPHLTLAWHLVSPRPVHFWYEYDLHWLSMCDYLYRMNGKSEGADREVRVAEDQAIHVVREKDYDVHQFIDLVKGMES